MFLSQNYFHFKSHNRNRGDRQDNFRMFLTPLENFLSITYVVLGSLLDLNLPLPKFSHPSFTLIEFTE